MQRTHHLYLEIDVGLYRLLEQAAQASDLSVEEECRRRLEGGERRSHYLQAVIANLRADEAQRLASERPR
jgi:hypothetical protein